jgi:hypothetical protein
MDLKAINLEIERSLSFEDSWSKFISLKDLAQTTESNQNLPSAIKERVLKRIGNLQMNIAGLEEIKELREDEFSS